MQKGRPRKPAEKQQTNPEKTYLDDATQAKLDRLANDRNVSKSQIIKDALREYFERVDAHKIAA